MVILAGLPGIIFNPPEIRKLLGNHPSYGYFYIFIIATVAFIALIVFMEKSKRKIVVNYPDGTEAYIPLKLTSAGTVPFDWTSNLLMAPVAIFQFIDPLIGCSISQKVSTILLPGTIGYFLAHSILLIFLYYLFTSFFYNPKEMGYFLGNKGAIIISSNVEKAEKNIDKSLETTIPIAVLYLSVQF
jgi:preprotein translocase subunit SecY